VSWGRRGGAEPAALHHHPGSATAWVDLSLEQQFTLWADRVSRPGRSRRSPEHFAACHVWAAEASRRFAARVAGTSGGYPASEGVPEPVGRRFEGWLRTTAGYRVQRCERPWALQPSAPPHVWLRATIDTERRVVTLFEELQRRTLDGLVRSGLRVQVDLDELVLAHEVFHLLCHEAPCEHAEGAAHLFATYALELSWFAGLADVVLSLEGEGTSEGWG
jgi:hypothetical protein